MRKTAAILLAWALAACSGGGGGGDGQGPGGGACSNQQKDGLETDVDCGGGECGACSTGKSCVEATD